MSTRKTHTQPTPPTPDIDPFPEVPEGVDPATGEILPAPATGNAIDAPAPRTIQAWAEEMRAYEPSPVEVVAAIMGLGQIPDTDPEDTLAGIMARILASPDAGALLRQSVVAHAQDMTGVDLEVMGVRWLPSEYEEGANVYALMDCRRLDTGEELLVSCGSTNVMLQLARAADGGWFPLRCQIIRAAKATKAGYYPSWLAPARDSG